ncbi:SNase-domain-containing protein [Patellaria atrata CBS 101060]|uniref:Probable endonuclease LCL3 n=1 Tax=Patellaria atrata CBS 101060 TaxID=1346257 RepID=A0A9P4S5A5_9PEZI|nr:SNase-domain-containing protein [Patellaria atrata CBS 101060]
MRFPFSRKDEENSKHESSWADNLNSTNWSYYTEPRQWVPTALLTLTTLTLIHGYKTYLRRIPTAEHMKPSFFRRRSVFGKVTSVGDGDNFRLFHTPGGKLAGWGWFPGRVVPSKREGLKEKTLHIRIAGIDAPELPHFGRPGQPYGEEALNWLKDYILSHHVRAYVYRRDQYERVVATVFVRKWFIRRDVGLQMLKAGLATVYEAKTGSEFGEFEAKYRAAEENAKRAKLGLWSKPSFIQRVLGEKRKESESPREFKNRMMATEEEAKKTVSTRKSSEKS